VFGQGAYYYAMIRALITEGNTVFEMEVEVDGVWQKFKVSSVIVTNATRFGGPHVVAPDARLDDGMLHVLLGMKHGRWNLMRYGAAYLRGKLFTLPDVRIITALRLRILSPIGKPVQLDGDNVLTLPVEISVAKETLGVICPD
jgi:diacylglycerol kinase (ATP)